MFFYAEGENCAIMKHMIDFRREARCMERVILHCDQNCFFASVELLSHPDLRDVPMAV